MAIVQLKKGNSATINITVYDEDTELFDFTDVEEIIYAIKENKTDTDASAKCLKKLTESEISQSSSIVSITIDYDDLDDVDTGMYYHSLQVEFASTRYEASLKNTVNILCDRMEVTQDIIRGTTS